jgi:hypothetical protein
VVAALAASTNDSFIGQVAGRSDGGGGLITSSAIMVITCADAAIHRSGGATNPSVAGDHSGSSIHGDVIEESGCACDAHRGARKC